MNNSINERDTLIIELLYATGIRVSELVNIKIKDINRGEKSIKVLGKGDKERRVYFDSVTFNPEQTDTAKTYIGLYDGQNYTNTSGMTPHISSSYIGIQINSSSRFT